MRRLIPASVAAIVVAGLLVVGLSGCGSDDTTPTGSIGNSNDPEYIVVNNQVDDFVDSSLAMLGQGLGSITKLAADDQIDPAQYIVVPGGSGDANSSYDQVTGWHTVWGTVEGTGATVTVLDSIQFRNGAGAFQQTVTDLASLTFKHVWSYDATDTAVTHTNYDGTSSFVYSNINTDQTTVSGSNNLQANVKIVAADSTVWRDLTIDGTFTGIQINKTGSGWAQSCPVSGSLAGSVDMSYKKGTADSVLSTWTLSLSIANGVFSSSIKSGNTTWNNAGNLCTPVL
ncbi:MAG: hypothetical protein ACE5FH_05385 [Candidatus Zixiibacteriota bacterium]